MEFTVARDGTIVRPSCQLILETGYEAGGGLGQLGTVAAIKGVGSAAYWGNSRTGLLTNLHDMSGTRCTSDGPDLKGMNWKTIEAGG